MRLSDFLQQRVLTKVTSEIRNDGADNADGDLICHVGDQIVTPEGVNYYIVDKLGQGTFGVVLKCEIRHNCDVRRSDECGFGVEDECSNEVSLGKPDAEGASNTVALKVIKNRPAYFQQGAVEVFLLETLRKKYDLRFVKMLDYFVYKRHLCIVFELLAMSVYDVLKGTGFRGLPTPIIKSIGYQMLRALVCLRVERIMHSDLKPENILLTNKFNSEIKIIDFGSGCLVDSQVYTYIQSRFYRSPDVLLGATPFTEKIDMWSFACILAELHLGHPLFAGSSEYDQYVQILACLGRAPISLVSRGTQRRKFYHGSCQILELREVKVPLISLLLKMQNIEGRRSLKKLDMRKAYRMGHPYGLGQDEGSTASNSHDKLPDGALPEGQFLEKKFLASIGELYRLPSGDYSFHINLADLAMPSCTDLTGEPPKEHIRVDPDCPPPAYRMIPELLLPGCQTTRLLRYERPLTVHLPYDPGSHSGDKDTRMGCGSSYVRTLKFHHDIRKTFSIPPQCERGEAPPKWRLMKRESGKEIEDWMLCLDGYENNYDFVEGPFQCDVDSLLKMPIGQVSSSLLASGTVELKLNSKGEVVGSPPAFIYHLGRICRKGYLLRTPSEFEAITGKPPKTNKASCSSLGTTLLQRLTRGGACANASKGQMDWDNTPEKGEHFRLLLVDLLSRCLEMEPAYRLGPAEALRHPLMTAFESGSPQPNPSLERRHCDTEEACLLSLVEDTSSFLYHSLMPEETGHSPQQQGSYPGGGRRPTARRKLLKLEINPAQPGNVKNQTNTPVPHPKDDGPMSYRPDICARISTPRTETLLCRYKGKERRNRRALSKAQSGSQLHYTTCNNDGRMAYEKSIQGPGLTMSFLPGDFAQLKRREQAGMGIEAREKGLYCCPTATDSVSGIGMNFGNFVPPGRDRFGKGSRGGLSPAWTAAAGNAPMTHSMMDVGYMIGGDQLGRTQPYGLQSLVFREDNFSNSLNLLPPNMPLTLPRGSGTPIVSLAAGQMAAYPYPYNHYKQSSEALSGRHVRVNRSNSQEGRFGSRLGGIH